MDRRDTAEPASLGALVPQEAKGEVDAFQLAEPTLGLGAGPPGEQVDLQFLEPGQHLGVDAQHRAADAGVFVLAGGAVGAAAGAQFDLALVEVLLELVPLPAGGLAVLLGGAELSTLGEEGHVVADDVLVEDSLWLMVTSDIPSV
jgi:hypothetical protein